MIVGAGLAGAKAAQELREGGFDGNISWIGAEHQRPYERGPLSNDYPRGEAARKKAFVHEPDFYERQQVELITGRCATTIDAHAMLAGVSVNVWDVNDHVQVLIRSGRPADTADLRDPDTRLDSRAVGSPTETR